MKEFGFKNIAPALKILGEIWKAMTDTEKKPYLDLSKRDGERYEK